MIVTGQFLLPPALLRRSRLLLRIPSLPLVRSQKQQNGSLMFIKRRTLHLGECDVGLTVSQSQQHRLYHGIHCGSDHGTYLPFRNP